MNLSTRQNEPKLVIVLSTLFFGFSNSLYGINYPSTVQEALKKVNSRVPKEFPSLVIPLPEPGELESKNQDELFEMARTWNPALRKKINYQLASLGDSVMPQVTKMLSSEDELEREVASSIAHSVLQYQIRNSTKFFPDEINWRRAQPKVRQKHKGLIPLLIPLCKDPVRQTRDHALRCLGELQARGKDVSEAVLGMFGDSDEYLAQQAMFTLTKFIGTDGVDQDTLFEAFEKGVQQPMPSGRGQIITLISQQDEAFQQRCKPFLIKHLNWIPKRDAMGAASGQSQALAMAKSMGDEALLETIPAMMTKKYKNSRIFIEEAVEAAATFGPKAKHLLPLFNQVLMESEEKLVALKKGGKNKFTNAQIEKLKNRIEVLKKGVASVSL